VRTELGHAIARGVALGRLLGGGSHSVHRVWRLLQAGGAAAVLRVEPVGGTMHRRAATQGVGGRSRGGAGAGRLS